MQANLNIIDVNQILSFFHYLELQRGGDFSNVWKKQEITVINILTTKNIDSKNLAIIANRFSHANQGSIEFWQIIDQVFQNMPLSMPNMDRCLVIHSFSLMNLLSKEKFIEMCFKMYHNVDVNPITPIDLSQILSTAKSQRTISGYHPDQI